MRIKMSAWTILLFARRSYFLWFFASHAVAHLTMIGNGNSFGQQFSTLNQPA